MPNSEPKRILIVEDDPFISDMYATKLKAEGFEAMITKNGKEGMEAVAEFKPDLLLLDIVMPQMDGFEVLQLVRANEETANTPVILLTNLGQKDDVEKGVELGANDYIVKAHFTPEEVIAKIRQNLGVDSKSS